MLFPPLTDTPFGQVPILEYEGTVITQSIAIARFLAKKADLYGKDDVTQAHADMIVDYVTDFNNSEGSAFIFPAKRSIDT